ncbi:MAG TPA: hypothetical protein VE620_02600 [Myxococcales bacterium]|jgi:hypothetical protein|nr:hypothetical protein [Myxococcales bacterium]
MIDEHEDPKFDAWLKDAAKSYNAPRRTPHEEMWARIQEGRRSRHVIEIRPWMRWALAAAAVLVIGIGIGRWTAHEPVANTPVVASTDAARSDVAYQVAAQQYLARTEVLLTDFRAQSGRRQLDPQFVAAARDLLTTTRLMLDSPAADDARLQPLLEDLEFVLAQITQLPTASGRKNEMDLINQGMTQRSVLTRLRTATPAVPAPQARAEGVL